MKLETFEIYGDGLEVLEAIQEETGLNDHADVLNNALTLFEWAINQKKRGNIIISLNEMRNEGKRLIFEPLENVDEEIVPPH